MSTDIFAFAERRVGSKWELAEAATWVPVVFFGEVQKEKELRLTSLKLDQNYELFAILAGVRNIRYDLTPITAARGLPSDASHEAKLEYARTREWSTWSWLTLAELEAYSWRYRPQTLSWHAGMGSGRPTCAELATRSQSPDTAPLFSETLPKLRGYGEPNSVRVLMFFY